MKKKIIIVVVLMILSFGIGFGLNSMGVFGNKLTAEAAAGQKNVSELFGEAKYDGLATGEGEIAMLRYIAGDFVVITDASGENILSVSLSPEAAQKAEAAQRKVLSDEELIEVAKKDLEKYVSIKYYLEAEMDEQGGIVNVTLRETKDGRETGAKGYMAYFPDGTLFSFTFTERVTDFPENEELMNVIEAYDRAYEYVIADRPDMTILYDPDTMNLREGNTVLGQMYVFDFYEKRPEGREWDNVCVVQVYAVSGELHSISYTDR